MMIMIPLSKTNTKHINKNDNELLSNYINGDNTAFNALVHKYHDEVYHFVRKRVPSHDDAQDICQNAFINLSLYAEQFSGRSKFRAWLYQIAINQYRNHYRSIKRQRTLMEALENIDAFSEDINFLSISNSEELALLRNAISKLPNKQRMVLQLRLYLNYSYAVIAETMGCAEGTAKAHHHQAVANLRKTLSIPEYYC